MRIPSGVTDQVVSFVAVDATDFTTRETGLTTFTVYRCRNGGTVTAMTTPTVTELDATNMPGVYKLLLDEDMTIGSGNDSEEMVFHITATGMAPVTRTIELYRPKFTVGATLALTDINAECDTAISDAALATAANLATVDTNVDAILVDTGTTIPATLTDIKGATFSSATDSLEAIRDRGDAAWTTGAGGSAPTAADNAAAVWNATLAAHTTAGTYGKAVADIETDATAILADTNELQTNQGDWATATGFATSAALATVDTNVDAILVDTGTTIPELITDTVGGISSTGGAALPVEAAGDNSSGAIVDSVTVIGTETGTFANTEAEDASYHVITGTATALDWVYEFTVGGGFLASGLTFSGYLTSANDSVAVQAWNGSTWDTRGTIAGQNGSVNVTETIELLSKHTVEGGTVYIRFVVTGGTNPVLNVDRLSVLKVNTSRTVGYADGAVWIDTVTGTAGTEAFINGVADNPVDSLADALTLGTSVGLRKFQLGNGSSITLTATTDNKVFYGHEWDIALGGQSIASTMFIDGNVSGIGSGTGAEFQDCVLGTTTLGPSQFYDTTLTDTLTIGSAGDYLFMDCASQVPGSGAPVLDFAAIGATTVSMRRWSGGLTVNNLAAGDIISVDCVSGGTITINGSGGTAVIRGMCNVVDGSGGAVSITQSSVINMTKINSEVDTALADYDAPTKAELDSGLAALPTALENADALLNRDMSAVSDTTARSPLNALRALRNKVSITAGTATVTKEDDTTSAWTSTITTDAAADNITGSDPA